MRALFLAGWFALSATAFTPTASALNGGELRLLPRNGWGAFEVITVRDNPSDDGSDWVMRATFDGIGAWRPENDTLRLLINHETSDATISQVDLDLAAFKSAIADTIAGGSPSNPFVNSAGQAFQRFSTTAGVSFQSTTSPADTSFARFCSGQSYEPNTFGAGRGFVDPVYITGEEVGGGRLVALDLAGADLYQLSGVTGNDGAGLSGMPFDAWENAALIDTGETDHVALLLSPDGGTQRMKLYVGQKGKGVDGATSDSFLARNGLAYGSHYFLNDALPDSGQSVDGFFDATASGALASSKLEDVDTNPNDPTQVVLGDQDSGLFTFDFDLAFDTNGFDAGTSGFSVTKVLDHNDNIDDLFGDADNVDWSEATTLGGVAYPNGLIFVNEDTGTGNGEVWMTTPDGAELTKIGDTAGVRGATESTGILDVSGLVGYVPGSVLLTNNQGNFSSLTTLIHPNAQAIDPDFNHDGVVDLADYTVWRDTGLSAAYYQAWRDNYRSTIPEPSAAVLLVVAVLVGVKTRVVALSHVAEFDPA